MLRYNLRMRTHTKCFNFSKLAAARGASTVVRLAMVCNDLAVANSSLGQYQKMSGSMRHIGQGGALYFVRMSVGHMREGMEEIAPINKDARLSALVDRGAPQAQKAFAKLCECLNGGKHHAKFHRHVALVRNKTGFHYDLAKITEALEFRIKHHSGSLCAVTIGEDIHSCRFDFADVVIDTIVCRTLWGIPMRADAQVAA